MASEIRVNTINNRSGLGTISITNSGAVFSGVTTFAQIKTTSGEVTVGTGASVFSPATNVLALGTNNTEKVRIDSSGSVGIGTDTITGKVQIDTTSGGRALTVNAPTNGTYITFETNDTPYADIGSEAGTVGSGTNDLLVLNARSTRDLAFRTNSAERLRITSTGDLVLKTSGTMPVGKFVFQEGSDDAFSFRTTGANGAFEIYDEWDNETRFHINTSGNIGIGTDNPSVNLHVKGSASNGQIYLGGTGAHSQIYADNDGVLILSADQGNSAANSYLGLYVDNTERLRIDQNGNVGIGTDIIEGKLTIFATAAEPPTSGTTANSAIQLYSSLSNQMNLGLNTVNGDYGAYIQVSDNNHAVNYPLNLQPNGGNIGAGGITTPTFTTGGGIHLGDAYGIGFGNGANGRPDFQIVYDTGQNFGLQIRCGNGADTADVYFTTAGNLAFASGKGIDFSATSDGSGASNVSELLDDYEEGTWTPTDASGGAQNALTAYGRYTKIGNLLFCTFDVTYPNTADTSVAAVSLPFSAGPTNLQGAGAFAWQNHGSLMTIYMGSSSNSFSFRDPTDTSQAGIRNNALSGQRLIGSITVRTS